MSVFNDDLFPSDWRPSDRRTLVYVVEGKQVLLIEKLTGHGAGKVNAPGGKVEEGELPSVCADRELFEEVGVRSHRKQLRGLLRFSDLDDGTSMFGFVYVCTKYSGTPSRSKEANPFWCDTSNVPYDEMWEGDRIWLADILAGRCLAADLLFKNDALQCSSMNFHSSISELQQEGDECTVSLSSATAL